MAGRSRAGSRQRAAGSLLLPLAAVTACSIGSNTYPINGPVKPAVNVPAQFVLADGSVRNDSSSSPGCRSPMVDPRDGTRIILVASQDGRVGDYVVPEAHYGVRSRELLRLDCGSGRVIGIIPDYR